MKLVSAKVKVGGFSSVDVGLIVGSEFNNGAERRVVHAFNSSEGFLL